jgi:hypothetical protein
VPKRPPQHKPQKPILIHCSPSKHQVGLQRSTTRKAEEPAQALSAMQAHVHFKAVYSFGKLKQVKVIFEHVNSCSGVCLGRAYVSSCVVSCESRCMPYYKFRAAWASAIAHGPLDREDGLVMSFVSCQLKKTFASVCWCSYDPCQMRRNTSAASDGGAALDFPLAGSLQ